MKKAILITILAVTPALAQRGSMPVGVENLQRTVIEQQQSVKEAVEHATMLSAVMSYHQDAQEALERSVDVAKAEGVSSAIAFIAKAKQRAAGAPDPSVRLMVAAAETMLADARLLAGSVNMPELIERFHHGPVHEMQRYVARQLGTLQQSSDRLAQIASQLDGMSRQLRAAQSGIVSSTIPRKEKRRD